MSSSDDDDFFLPGTGGKPNTGGGSASGAPAGGAPAAGSTGSPTGGGGDGYAAGLLSNLRRRGPPPKRASPTASNAPGRVSPSVQTPTSPAAPSPTGPTKSAPPKPSVAASPVQNTPVPDKPPVAPAAVAQPAQAEGGPLSVFTAPNSAKGSSSTPSSGLDTASVSVPASMAPTPAQVAPVVHPTPVPAAAPVEPPKPVLDQARIDDLKAQVAAKKAQLAALKEKESSLANQQRQSEAAHKDKMATLESDVRRAWRSVEDERERGADEVNRAEQERERAVREARQRIEEKVASDAAPKLSALRDELASLTKKRDQLQQGLKNAGSNKSLVDSAVSAALSKVLSSINTHYKDTLEHDPEWEDSVASLIKKEVRASFAASAAGEADSERQEMTRAFNEAIEFWRSAEEEERRQVAAMDEQLLLDLQAAALDDMDRLQREELAMQEVYMETREAWAQHHRSNLNAELEAALQRRAIEFEDQRSQRQQLAALKVSAAEEQHKRELGALKAMHEREVQMLREAHAQKQLLHDAHHKAMAEAREEAARSTATLGEVVTAISRTMEHLDGYKMAVDESRSAVDQERQRHLSQREATMTDAQSIVLTQAQAVEKERKALSGALVKLDVVHAGIEKQLEDERSWMARNVASLERSRADWEREYRRWQHVAQQEKLDAEQRFSNVILDLRQAAAALEEEGKELDVEAASLKRHCSERSSRSASEVQELERKEAELNQRYEAMVGMVRDVEIRSQQLTNEWQRLREERQQLALERQDLGAEEQKLQALTGNLRQMRQAVDTAHVDAAAMGERTRAMRHGVQASRQAVAGDMKNLDEQARRLQQQREKLEREQAVLNDMVLGGTQDMANRGRQPAASARPAGAGVAPNPNRLPNRVMAELHDLLNQTAATQQSVAVGLESRSTAAPPQASTHFDATHMSTNAPSSQHFTNLVHLSEAESGSPSQLSN